MGGAIREANATANDGTDASAWTNLGPAPKKGTQEGEELHSKNDDFIQEGKNLEFLTQICSFSLENE